MQSILKDIQEAVIKYADILCQILQVEVEIVDENFIRIAGTGIYKNKINEDMSKEGYVYKTTMLSGKSQIINNPGKEKICIPCPKKDTCEEKFEMSDPIKIKGKVTGVIGLVCFTDKQKNHLMANFDVYMAFLQQISEFISITAYEKMEEKRTQKLLNLFKMVINRVEQGVIILDRHSNITHINENALKQLKVYKDCIGKKAQIKINGDNVFDRQEYKLIIGEEVFYLIGTIYPVELEDKEYNKMFFFEDVKSFKAKLSKYASTKETMNCGDIIGECDKIQKLKKNIKKISVSTSTVLITGESGTGKEMVARAIHGEGSRKDKTFIPINCGAIPEALLESELFGYVKGAFTGADPMGKIGKFELANKGTIFLDEIGDMPLYLQTKLLRVLQERKITRVGSNKTIEIDVRVIAATNRTLEKMIEENKFRDDLYYRLNVIPIEVPPLRDRTNDIKILVNSFIQKYLKVFNKNFLKVKIEEKVWDIFYKYSWPGNIRELENTVEFIVNMVSTDGTVNKGILPKSIINNERVSLMGSEEIHSLKEVEKEEIKKALDKFGMSTEGKKMAANKLGIGIATLYRKVEEYKLSK